MNIQTDALKVSTEFTREGLRQHVLSHLDEESYSDESLYSLFEEFNYRLGLKAKRLGEMMEGFGIQFFWAVNLGKAIYSPKDELDEYIYKDTTKTEWRGINAILAFLRDEINVESLESDYWSSRSPHISWSEESNLRSMF